MDNDDRFSLLIGVTISITEGLGMFFDSKEIGCFDMKNLQEK